MLAHRMGFAALMSLASVGLSPDVQAQEATPEETEHSQSWARHYELPNAEEYSYGWLMAELDADEQELFVALYADLAMYERAALLDMSDQLPVGERGIFAAALLRMEPAEVSALIEFLSYLGGNRWRLVDAATSREPRRWDALGTYAAQVTPPEVAWALFVAGPYAACPDPAYPGVESESLPEPMPDEEVGQLLGSVIGTRIGEPSGVDWEEAAAPQCSPAVLAFMEGWNRPIGRLTNGQDVRPGDAPWQAQLIRSEAGLALWTTPRFRRAELEIYGEYLPDWENRHVCGGVYLGDNWVVTAAHCLEGWGGRDLRELMRVRLGATDAETGGREFEISAAVIHAGYTGRDSDYRHDIALLRLSGEVGSSGIRTAAVPRAPYRDSRLITPLMLTGWGLTGRTYNATLNRDISGRPQRYSRILQQGDLYLHDPSTCGNDGALDGITIWPGQLCASSIEGVDSCRGDSGGPLVLVNRGRRELVGIVSYGAGCGLEGTPKIFTDVGYYRDWIRRAREVSRDNYLMTWACDVSGWRAC
ncbi:trypsin-like serine protease [Aurantiacibacter sp. MUD11]|uniref:trypsin-like serine protease n=1 Tax=Aurantiacibacter sp. MUD11 TaxID=3003265 RepID=UPI0022AAA6A2|nr:trypsin-like serine protease [Aurantiacibacter sp. MUD11]WAT17007.1 trypsin-like serine protease [Aurantiacibacter sp. MUD11]